MVRKFWDTWGIAIIAGLLTGLPLTVVGAYLGAYVTNTPIKHPLTLGWLVNEMHRSVPMWFAFSVITFAATMTALYIRQRAAKNVVADAHEDAVAAQKELERKLSAVQSIPQPDIPSITPQSTVRPDLTVFGSKIAAITFSMSQRWKETDDGFDAVVVPILNQVAPIGHAGVTAKSLVAALQFETTQGRVLHHVARAYWLNHSENQIDLECGETAAVVIGAIRKPYEWTMYENPNAFPVAQQRFRSGMVVPQAPKHWVPFTDALRVTLSLITTDDGKTVEVLHFVLEISEDGKSVRTGTYR